jgi:hypothetical protein
VIRLYSGSGSGEIELDGPSMTDGDWQRLRSVAVRLLRTRGASKTAAVLEATPFDLLDAHNGFGDDFCVLHWDAPMEKYVEASEWTDNAAQRAIYADIAKTVTEVIPGYIRFVVVALDTHDGPASVESPSLAITSDVVERALKDAEALIASTGATSGVDRVHTALHGYLKAAADKHGLTYAVHADVVALVKVLLKGHPSFANTTTQTDKVVKAFAVIVDALNPLRNDQSMAHPNASLLAEPEAMLVINTVRTLLHYVDAKIR